MAAELPQNEPRRPLEDEAGGAAPTGGAGPRHAPGASGSAASVPGAPQGLPAEKPAAAAELEPAVRGHTATSSGAAAASGVEARTAVTRAGTRTPLVATLRLPSGTALDDVIRGSAPAERAATASSSGAAATTRTPTAPAETPGPAPSASPSAVPPSTVRPPTVRLLPPPLRGARAAFIFFSRLPAGGFPYRSADWHWAPAHLPLVGIVVGGLSAAVFALGGALGLGPLLRASLALGASLWLTGALHEDGLADAADGLGGGRDPERALEIMKDSRIGTFGAAALTLSLLGRAAALAELAASAWFAIVYVHVVARAVPVWLSCVEPYVNDRPDAKSRGLLQTRPLHVLGALGWCTLAATFGIASGMLPWPAALAGAALPLALAPWMARYFRQRIGGVTGDLLGAAEQIAELAAWVAVSAALAP